jgi:hypothetical protein
MPRGGVFEATLFGQIDILYPRWYTRCQPRLLVVTDSSLSFEPASFFGLSRFVQAISQSPLAPLITLAHRGAHAPTVNIYNTNYPVLVNFKFDPAATAVTVANYDQIWMFGFDTGTLPAVEAKKIADFMNAGGGVFATGDHKTLGKAMGGQLPRIRHMRDWSNVTMGLEGNQTARDRIDTVVDPGSNATYEFDDQGDEFPQRIYPNYDVTFSSGVWTATLHALLRMPGAALNRTNATGFTNDIDCMPDHPHESVCFEVSGSVNAPAYNGTYNEAGIGNFQEFPNAASGGGRVGSRIIAYAVSGGRSVYNNGWKPPVNPRMFGIISAFDGHAASPYLGQTSRPGRIVCDSTWHHFVNVNIDGTSTGHTGLGSNSGLNFVPSAKLLKIYQYYRNALDWLQPQARIWCWWYPHLVWLRFHPALIEELVEVGGFKEPREFQALGRDALRILDEAYGSGRTADALATALRLDPATARLVDSPDAAAAIGADEAGGSIFTAHLVGKALAFVAQAIPADRPDQLEKAVKGQHERLERELPRIFAQAAGEAIADQIGQAEGRLRALIQLRSPPVKGGGKQG